MFFYFGQKPGLCKWNVIKMSPAKYKMYATLQVDKVLFYDVIWHVTMPKNYKYFMRPVSLVPCVVVLCQHKSPSLKLAW